MPTDDIRNRPRQIRDATCLRTCNRALLPLSTRSQRRDVLCYGFLCLVMT